MMDAADKSHLSGSTQQHQHPPPPLTPKHTATATTCTTASSDVPGNAVQLDEFRVLSSTKQNVELFKILNAIAEEIENLKVSKC